MIEVELPDGSVAEFPDGTPPETMKSAIQKRFPIKASSGVSPDAFRPETFEKHDDDRSLFTRVDDAVRGAADAVTFGFADEIAAGADSALGSGDYESNLAAQRERDANGGWERFGGQLAGAFAVPGVASRSIPGAALAGMGQGGLYGLGSGEGAFEDRLDDAAIGGVAGGVLGAGVRAGANALQRRAARKAIPTNEQLQETAGALFKRADDAGGVFSNGDVKKLARNIVDDLTDKAFDPINEPGVVPALRRLRDIDASGQSMTFKGLRALRRAAQNGYIAGNKSNNAAISAFIERIDEIADGSGAAGGIAKEASDLWSRSMRSAEVDAKAYKAERNAAASGSGGNIDNSTRQAVNRMLDKPRGMKPKEIKAAERVVFGTTPQNLLRKVGKLAPGGNGLMTALGAGATMINPVYGVPALVGGLAKAASDRMTVKNVEKLSELIRSGGYTADDLARLARDNKIPMPLVKAIEKAEKDYRARLSMIGAMMGNRETKPPVMKRSGTPLEITVNRPSGVQ